MIGKVVSAKMKDTVIVEVGRMVPHPLYKKRLKKTSRFHVHDELGAKEGDTVRFESTKPISKMKYHKIAEVLKKVKTNDTE